MFNKEEAFFSLPQPVKCHCDKGYLLPILQPVTLRGTGMNFGHEFWGDKYQVTWECSFCHIVIKGNSSSTTKKKPK